MTDHTPHDAVDEPGDRAADDPTLPGKPASIWLATNPGPTTHR